jgi:hypothetical protein
MPSDHISSPLVHRPEMTIEIGRRAPRSAGLPGVALALLSAAGCACPETRIDRLAAQAQLTREVVDGAGFEHVLYRSTHAQPGPQLHVYIEGDGSPYLDRFVVAPDPTPRRPVMLELMSHDPAPALYLGRPCYFGQEHDPGCGPQYWTLRRFSPEVVASLAQVVRAEIARTHAEHVTLLGHSGGATLALLLAQRVPQVHRVITIAGNLDPLAWSRMHGYQPLSGSLDPVEQSPPRSDLLLTHYAGGADQNIPPEMIRSAAQRVGGSVVVVPGFTHTCCWSRIWPQILSTAN